MTELLIYIHPQNKKDPEVHQKGLWIKATVGSLPFICCLEASHQDKRTVVHLCRVSKPDSPSSVSAAVQDAVPPPFVATQVYSPSSSGYTLEISSWQLSSNWDIRKNSDCLISFSLWNQLILTSGQKTESILGFHWFLLRCTFVLS